MVNSELLFVYNANSGVGNALIDYGKKLVAPNNYDCNLCMASYGPFGMKKDWKQFIKSLDTPVKFLHKDEFEKRFTSRKQKYPCLVGIQNKQLTTLLSAKDFESIQTLDQLIAAVKKTV